MVCPSGGRPGIGEVSAVSRLVRHRLRMDGTAPRTTTGIATAGRGAAATGVVISTRTYQATAPGMGLGIGTIVHRGTSDGDGIVAMSGIAIGGMSGIDGRGAGVDRLCGIGSGSGRGKGTCIGDRVAERTSLYQLHPYPHLRLHLVDLAVGVTTAVAVDEYWPRNHHGYGGLIPALH
jgi:hypothetical protein